MHEWNDAEVHVVEAGERFAEGRYADAERALRRALSVVPDEPEWLFNLGLTLEMLERHRDAAVAFARSHRFTALRSDDTAGLDLETDYLASGPDPEGSESLGSGTDAGAANSGQAQSAASAHRVGVNLLSIDDHRRAERWFARAIRHDRSQGESHAGRIAALGELARYTDAKTVFFEAQQDVNEDARIYVAISGVLMASGDRERAIWCLREASRLDPHLPHVRRKLASIFADSKRYERARQLFLAELRQDPGDIATLLDLGRLLTLMNRPEEAAEKFRRILELVPDHAAGHFALADLAESTGDHDAALRGFEVLARLDRNHHGVRPRLANLLLNRAGPGDLTAARDLLRRERSAIRRRPGGTPAGEVHELAVMLIRADLCGEAVPMLEQLSQFAGASDVPLPQHALILHHLAVARLELGDLDEGMAAARQAVNVDPRLTPAMHNLALGHIRLGQWDRARYWTRRAAAVDPDDISLSRLKIRLRLRVLIGVWRKLAWFARPIGRRTSGTTSATDA